MDKKKARSLSERLIWIEENLMALIVLAVTIVLFINVLLSTFPCPSLFCSSTFIPYRLIASNAIVMQLFCCFSMRSFL